MIDFDTLSYLEQVNTLEQAAKKLGVSVKHVQKLIDAGALRAFNVGLGSRSVSLRIEESELDRFVAVRRVQPASGNTMFPLPRPAKVRESHDSVSLRERLARARANKDRI